MKILEFFVNFSMHKSSAIMFLTACILQHENFGVYGQVLQSSMHQSSANLFWSLRSGSPIIKAPVKCKFILEFTVRFSNQQCTSQVQNYFGVYSQVLQSANEVISLSLTAGGTTKIQVQHLIL